MATGGEQPGLSDSTDTSSLNPAKIPHPPEEKTDSESFKTVPPLDLADRIDSVSENYIKEATTALGTVSTSSDDVLFSFNVYGTVDTPPPSKLRDAGRSTTPSTYSLSGFPANSEVCSDTNLISTPHPTPQERGRGQVITSRCSLTDDANRAAIDTELFHSPPMSKDPSKHQLLGISGTSSGYETHVHESVTHVSDHVPFSNMPKDKSLNLPPFLQVDLVDHQESLVKIHKTSVGFLERSKELQTDKQPTPNPSLDKNLHSQPPLGQRPTEWRRKHRSPTKDPHTTKPCALKQLKLTNLFDKRPSKLTSEEEIDPAAHTGPSSPTIIPQSGLDPSQSFLGSSHPIQGQVPPVGSKRGPQISIGNGSEHTNEFHFADPTDARGDLSILDDVVRADLDWTRYTQFNKWGDTPTATQPNSVVSLETNTLEDQHPKSVHFNPFNAPTDATTDDLSISISQLGIDDGDEFGQDMMMETNPTTTPSLAEALTGTTTTTTTNPDDETTTKGVSASLELPYLAEVTWKQARGAARAGIKARSYARHLLDLSADVEHLIITHGP